MDASVYTSGFKEQVLLWGVGLHCGAVMQATEKSLGEAQRWPEVGSQQVSRPEKETPASRAKCREKAVCGEGQTWGELKYNSQ